MQKISELTDEMAQSIKAKRDWVRNHYTPENLNEYDSVKGKLTLLDTILKSNWIDKKDKVKLQCLGITLGDTLIQDMNFIWVQVEDEYGTDPAIQLPDTTIILFPLTMISKRIEANETVDINELYVGLKEKVNEIRTNI
ncbi:MAG: hypothetical protein K0S32_114 [Bacteroidetes bacterium]|jgi:hypothetical protein|nr:hypothetical protein [Bacteroidota bacterium]